MLARFNRGASQKVPAVHWALGRLRGPIKPKGTWIVLQLVGIAVRSTLRVLYWSAGPDAVPPWAGGWFSLVRSSKSTGWLLLVPALTRNEIPSYALKSTALLIVLVARKLAPMPTKLGWPVAVE